MNSGKTSFKFNSQRVFEADSQVTLNTYLNIYEQDLLGKAAHLPQKVSLQLQSQLRISLQRITNSKIAKSIENASLMIFNHGAQQYVVQRNFFLCRLYVASFRSISIKKKKKKKSFCTNLNLNKFLYFKYWFSVVQKNYIFTIHSVITG